MLPQLEQIKFANSFNWGLCCFFLLPGAGGGNDIQWCFSQVKGAVDDDVAEGKKRTFISLSYLSLSVLAVANIFK